MVEEMINELIIQMENRGWEYVTDKEVGIKFKSLDDAETFMNLNDWDDVSEFIENNPLD